MTRLDSNQRPLEAQEQTDEDGSREEGEDESAPTGPDVLGRQPPALVDLQDHLQRCGQISVVGDKHKCPYADLRQKHRRVDVGEELVVEAPVEELLPQVGQDREPSKGREGTRWTNCSCRSSQDRSRWRCQKYRQPAAQKRRNAN
jgi:hypothetical protein